MQIVFAEHASATALHLFEIVFAAHIPHEDQALDGFNIGASGNHVHCNCNTGVVIIAEVAEYTFWVFSGVGYLLAELVSFTKLVPDNLNNVVSMAVGLSKNQSFRDFLTSRKQHGKEVVPKGSNHHTNLAWIHNISVQLRRMVVYVLIQLLPALFP